MFYNFFPLNIVMSCLINSLLLPLFFLMVTSFLCKNTLPLTLLLIYQVLISTLLLVCQVSIYHIFSMVTSFLSQNTLPLANLIIDLPSLHLINSCCYLTVFLPFITPSGTGYSFSSFSNTHFSCIFT